jgi:Uma2 family endonuclease
MVDTPKLYTVEEFEALIARPENAGRRLELINGEIYEKMPTEEHGMVILVIAGEIYIYLKQNPIARAGVEVRHRVEGDVHNDRMPDLSVTTDMRGPVPQMPDLAVEVKSPDDTYRVMRDKAAYYLQHSTRLVWLVYPEKRLVEVYRPDADSALLDINDSLDGGEVLPGFRLAIKDLFAGLTSATQAAPTKNDPEHEENPDA